MNKDDYIGFIIGLTITATLSFISGFIIRGQI